ncbi:hypothetical protein IMCC13023_10320 [Candidatus Aquiluna sp. IMCC13023]|nr:hypothetical protein IMCC13023_10320 [Candidatus Aquiluna sp. IMCC13023]
MLEIMTIIYDFMFINRLTKTKQDWEKNSQTQTQSEKHTVESYGNDAHNHGPPGASSRNE